MINKAGQLTAMYSSTPVHSINLHTTEWLNQQLFARHRVFNETSLRRATKIIFIEKGICITIGNQFESTRKAHDITRVNLGFKRLQGWQIVPVDVNQWCFEIHIVPV